MNLHLFILLWCVPYFVLQEMQVAQVLAQLQCVLRAALVLFNNIYCIPTYLVWMWAILLPFRETRIYIWIEKILYRHLLLMVCWKSKSMLSIYGQKRITRIKHKADILLTSLPAKRGVVLHFRILELRHQSIRLCNIYILLWELLYFFHKSSS